jgi:hypothetical protein
MSAYFVIAPGYGPYAATIYGKTRKDARRAYAAFLGRKRCPAGTRLWTVS